MPWQLWRCCEWQKRKSRNTYFGLRLYKALMWSASLVHFMVMATFAAIFPLIVKTHIGKHFGIGHGPPELTANSCYSRMSPILAPSEASTWTVIGISSVSFFRNMTKKLFTVSSSSVGADAASSVGISNNPMAGLAIWLRPHQLNSDPGLISGLCWARYWYPSKLEVWQNLP